MSIRLTSIEILCIIRNVALCCFPCFCFGLNTEQINEKRAGGLAQSKKYLHDIQPETQKIKSNKYFGHFDYTGKFGTTRSIQRLDLFTPLFKHDDSLIFMDIRAGNDSRKNREYNLGLGFRNIYNNKFIYGLYLYYDGKRSPNHNLFHQITIGNELLFSNFETRFNAYIPVGKRTYNLPVNYRNEEIALDIPAHRYLVQMGINRFEKSYSGFDFEIGGSLPTSDFKKISAIDYFLNNLNFYVTYYQFMANKMDTINGVVLKFELTINRYLTFEASNDLGDKNNHAKYLGLRITIPFGTPNEIPSNLQRKMISLPTRDIDVISASKKTIEHEFEINGNDDVVLINDADGNYKGQHFVEHHNCIQKYRENKNIIAKSLHKKIIKVANRGAINSENINFLPGGNAKNVLHQAAEQQRLAAEQAERDRQAEEQAKRHAEEQARRHAEAQEERDRLAAEQEKRDRLAEEQEERDRLAEEQAERDRLAEEQLLNKYNDNFRISNAGNLVFNYGHDVIVARLGKSKQAVDPNICRLFRLQYLRENNLN